MNISNPKRPPPQTQKKTPNWALFLEVEQNELAKNIRSNFPVQHQISFYHPILEIYARNNLSTKRLNHQYRLVEIQDLIRTYDLHVKQYRARVMRKRKKGGISFETRHVVIKEIPLLPLNLLSVFNQHEKSIVLPSSLNRIPIQFLYSKHNPVYIELLSNYLCSYLVEQNYTPHFTLLYGTASTLFKRFTYLFKIYETPYLDENTKIRKYVKDDRQHIVTARVPVQLIFQESIKFSLDEALEHDGYCAKIWKSYLFQVFAALSIVHSRYKMCHNDLHIGNIMYTNTKQKFIYYHDSDETVYRVPTYGKIIKIIDWGRATLTYQGHEFRNLCFSYDGEAYTQYYWQDSIKSSKPVQVPNIAVDIILFAHSLYTSQPKLPKDSLTQYINRLCDLPTVGNMLTKHKDLNFSLYEDVAKHGNNIYPLQQLRHPIFRSYLVTNQGAIGSSSIYLLE